MKIKNYVKYASIIIVSLNPFVSFSRADNLLSQGDDALLASPVANFRNELKRLKLPPAQFQAVPTASEGPQTNIALELEDLRFALRKAGKSSNEVEQIVTKHLVQRTKLTEFGNRLEFARQASGWTADEDRNARQDARSKLEFPKINLGVELPDEFADYLEGTLAWQNPTVTDKTTSRQAWERILQRPAKERRFKSTSAAFMLGRAWEKENPEKAALYFQQVRALTKAGFSDRLGLAAASLGWEARAWLNQTNYERALDLYLQQLATGDASASMSICLTMREIVRGGTESFASLAGNPRTRRVVTAYIISTRALQISYANSWNSEDGSSNRLVNFVSEWLAVNETTKVSDSEMTEEFALAAYQNGQWETAAQWIARSPGSATALWLQAKLLFRARKFAQAAALLERVAGLFPLSRQQIDAEAPRELKENLTISTSGYQWPYRDAAHQIRAELGVLHLGRGQYGLALDDFLRAELWEDAAYVAERMLSVDELKSYVDQYWPLRPKSSVEETVGDRETHAWSAELQEKLRHLLARRLTRTIRGDEAREYYPAQWQPHFDELATALRTAWDVSLTSDQRANAFVQAAIKTRAYGMELLATEVGPDWHHYNGNREGDLSAAFRTNNTFTLLPASSDELARYAQHHADPENRFHYRYQAAFLGWEAVKLSPNNSENAARILCLAGSWLKARDAVTADLFYKTLAQRFPNTTIGAEANRIHWFPQLDEDGNLLMPEPSSEPTVQPIGAHAIEAEESPDDDSALDYPAPGHHYILQEDDTLEDVAQAASAWGEQVTVEDITAANPGLDSSELHAGLRLLIPNH